MPPLTRLAARDFVRRGPQHTQVVAGRRAQRAPHAAPVHPHGEAALPRCRGGHACTRSSNRQASRQFSRALSCKKGPRHGSKHAARPAATPPAPSPHALTCGGGGVALGDGDEVQGGALLGRLRAPRLLRLRRCRAPQRKARRRGVLRPPQVVQHRLEGVGLLHRLPRADARQDGSACPVRCCSCLRRCRISGPCLDGCLLGRLWRAGRCAGGRGAKAKRKSGRVGGCRRQGGGGRHRDTRDADAEQSRTDASPRLPRPPPPSAFSAPGAAAAASRPGGSPGRRKVTVDGGRCSCSAAAASCPSPAAGLAAGEKRTVGSLPLAGLSGCCSSCSCCAAAGTTTPKLTSVPSVPPCCCCCCSAARLRRGTEGGPPDDGAGEGVPPRLMEPAGPQLPTPPLLHTDEGRRLSATAPVPPATGVALAGPAGVATSGLAGL